MSNDSYTDKLNSDVAITQHLMWNFPNLPDKQTPIYHFGSTDQTTTCPLHKHRAVIYYLMVAVTEIHRTDKKVVHQSMLYRSLFTGIKPTQTKSVFIYFYHPVTPGNRARQKANKSFDVTRIFPFIFG